MTKSNSAGTTPSSTTCFYAPPESFSGKQVTLTDAEAHHLHRVLRLQTGDEVDVVDGVGGWYRVRLADVDGDRATGTVIDRSIGVGEPLIDVRLGIGLLKNRSRLEFAVEKSVELGVNSIHLLECRHCETRRVDVDRLRRLAAAAMKQSRRSVLTRVADPVSFEQFLTEQKTDCGWILEPQPEAVHLADLLQGQPVEEAVVLVGPEGGFSAAESEMAIASAYTCVSLGSRRLRAETAAVAACGALMIWSAAGK